MESIGEWVIIELVEAEEREIIILPSSLGNDPIAQKARVVCPHPTIPGSTGSLERGDLILVTLIGSSARIYLDDQRILYAVNQYNIIAKLSEEDEHGSRAAAGAKNDKGIGATEGDRGGNTGSGGTARPD